MSVKTYWSVSPKFGFCLYFFYILAHLTLKFIPYKNLRCPENLLLLKGITHSIKCCLKLMRIEYLQVSLEFYFHIMDNNLHLPADKCRKFMSKSNHLK